MKRVLAERLGSPPRPVPVLLPPGKELGAYGRQEGTIDWAYYHLGRPVLAVPVTGDVRRRPADERLFLVARTWLPQLKESVPLRVIAASKFMLLVEAQAAEAR
jgi:hypothetical protein